ncbi:uncharacterized protein LOC131860276 [Cryptomeria japonica]|uniref:uncharacterized protein LOC131860276 n=1 Tax=Cryptomeria japonica TaxID=3369 RepID=UPI0027DA83FF|nr:uncharacterized protein LOC131860276 [Cryptomeria japonica]
MDLSFGHIKDKIIVVYLDDLTIFLKRGKHHLRDLRQGFQRCQEHGVSLNLKKSVFGVTEGKLLGHIISKEVRVHPERVKAIQQLSLPSNRNAVKPFFGQVNFLRRFVPDFAEITRYIVHVMSEKKLFKWNEEGKKEFESIKQAIAQAPILVNLDFKKDFIIYYYASEHTMLGILLQKNEVTEEFSLVLFVGLQDSCFVVVAFYLTYGDCPEHPSPREKMESEIKDCQISIPVRKTTSEVVCSFLKENILVRFGVPQKIVADNATNLFSAKISLFFYDNAISLAHSSDYYPQGNVQVESSNKTLINIMKKLVSENFKDWHKRLHETLREDHTSPKRTIGMSPFEIVYGMGAQVSLPLELVASKLQTVIQDVYFQDSLEKRIMHWMRIDEEMDKLV